MNLATQRLVDGHHFIDAGTTAIATLVADRAADGEIGEECPDGTATGDVVSPGERLGAHVRGGDEAGGRFGAYAMELLINELIKQGARRGSLQAKIFGGGQVMRSLARTQIGEKNVAFVRAFLAQEGISVLASDVLGVWPRKVCLFPRSGQVLCKRLPAAQADDDIRQEESYRAQLVREPRGGEVELFS